MEPCLGCSAAEPPPETSRVTLSPRALWHATNASADKPEHRWFAEDRETHKVHRSMLLHIDIEAN